MAATKGIKKIVLAYSGGLDTSAIIPWLKENYGDCEVVAFVADIGQERGDLEGIEQKALRTGASECHVVDLREEFIKDYVYPVLKSGALYEGSYLLGTSMARPLIAKAQVELALKVGADALCHGATGKGNDQVRFETTYTALAPQLKVVAPWREWDLRSREALLDYLKERNIPTTASLEKIYSRDENAWHISTEGGVLESPWNAANKDCWAWTVAPEDAPDQAETVTVKVAKGEVVAVNGVELSPYQCLEALNVLGVKHGIGRIDLVENRYVGIKSRGCYETPGGTIMLKAHRAIESITLDREVAHLKDDLMPRYASMIYNGYWWAPERVAIQTLIDHTQATVNGWVRIKLYKGNVIVVSRDSKTDSLFDMNIATFDEDGGAYNQADAGGFIKLNALRMRIAAIAREKRDK